MHVRFTSFFIVLVDSILVVIRLQKMVNGGTVNFWICINFSRNVQDTVARGFCNELAQMCVISGMVWALRYSTIICFLC